MKLYFSKLNEDFCHTESAIKEMMVEQGLTEIKVTEAKADIGGPAFYCNLLNEVGGRFQDYCGKVCTEYAPRNGKSGRCKHHKHTYCPGEKTKVITLKKI